MPWKLIRQGEDHGALSGHREYQLDSTDDMKTENIPPDAQTSSPGSYAWIGDYSHFWNKKNDGSWADILGDGEG